MEIPEPIDFEDFMESICERINDDFENDIEITVMTETIKSSLNINMISIRDDCLEIILSATQLNSLKRSGALIYS